MRRFHYWGLLLLVPALAFLVITPGCSKKDKDKTDVSKDDDKDDEGKDKDDDGGDGSANAERTELGTTGWGTLKGTVTLAGKVPEPGSLVDQIEKSKDAKTCEAGLPEEKDKQGWKVRAKDKRVANVVVWIKPPEGKCFKLPPKDERPDEWQKPVQIDQPHCAFVPHVSVAWPKYYDPKQKKLVASGQEFQILNSANIPHNTRPDGNPRFNTFTNQVLPAKTKGKPTVRVIKLNPQPSEISLNCDIHKWMSGKVWALDHPYAAVTKGDHVKDRDEDEAFGTYEIKMVPTGKKVRLVVWHEQAGYIYGKDGKEIELKKGDNTIDIEIPKK
jgi:hypothetical protein